MYIIDVEIFYKKRKRILFLIWILNFDFVKKFMFIFMKFICFIIVGLFRKKGNRVKRDNLGLYRK